MGECFHSVYVYQTITMHILSCNVEAEKDLNQERSTENGSHLPQVPKPAPQLLIIVDACWALAAHQVRPELAGHASHLIFPEPSECSASDKESGVWGREVRERKQLPQGHLAGKTQRQDWNLRSYTGPRFLVSLYTFPMER